MFLAACMLCVDLAQLRTQSVRKPCEASTLGANKHQPGLTATPRGMSLICEQLGHRATAGTPTTAAAPPPVAPHKQQHRIFGEPLQTTVAVETPRCDAPASHACCIPYLALQHACWGISPPTWCIRFGVLFAMHRPGSVD